MLGDILFALHGGDGAVSGSGNDLTQGLDADIAGSVNAGDVGAHALVGLDVAVLHVQDALEHTGGLLAGEAEQTEEAVFLVSLQDLDLAGHGVLDGDLAQQLAAADLEDLGVAHDIELGVQSWKGTDGHLSFQACGFPHYCRCILCGDEQVD